jgi:hypothetical protein
LETDDQKHGKRFFDGGNLRWKGTLPGQVKIHCISKDESIIHVCQVPEILEQPNFGL